MKLRLKIKLLLVLIWMSLIMGCEPGGDTLGLKQTLVINALNIVKIDVEPTVTFTLNNSDFSYFSTNYSEQLVAYGVSPDNSRSDVSTGVVWSSSNTSVAKISDSGYLTTAQNLASVTEVQIYADMGSLRGIANIRVSPEDLANIVFQNGNTGDEITTDTVILCDQLPLNAIGEFDDASKRTITKTTDWSIGGNPIPPEAKVGDDETNKGIFSAYKIGSYVVSADYQSTTGDANPSTLTIDVMAEGFSEPVTVTPNPVTIATSDTQEFQATAVISEKTKSITYTALWKSSDLTVATQPVNGSTEAVDVGRSNITATCITVDGDSDTEKTGTAVLTVRENTVKRVEIRDPTSGNVAEDPEDISLSSSDKTREYSLWAILTSGPDENVTADARWTTNNVTDTVGDIITRGEIDEDDDKVEITANKVGVAHLTGEFGGLSETITINVIE